MTFVAPERALSSSTRIPSIIVLGADAVLAALPATPVQLAHACLLAGYQSVVPASWGDELIAAATLRALPRHGQLPAIQCACPYVAHRLLAAGTDLRPFLVSLVAPPVALARYLRAASAPAKLRITYVGRCPGAADESIDARLTPEELLAIFADRQIALGDQPRVFDSVIPPDRRRFRSQPGGLPTAEMLWSSAPGANGNGRSLVELQSDELPVELAQHLLAGKPVLIDAAAKLGCVCSGGGAGIEPAESRERVIAVEPPRAASPVVDETVPVELELPLPASPRSAIDIVAPPSSALYAPTSPQPPLADEHVVEEARRAEDEVDAWWRPPSRLPESGSSTQGQLPRRHSPTRGIARPASGTLPTARDASGRQLPRTYVARRRSPGRTGRALSVDAPVESADKSDVQPVTPPRDRSARPDNFGSPSERTLEPRSTASAGVELSEPSTAPRTVPPTRTETELHEESRFQERAVKLPVTPLSDAPPREEATKPTRTLGDRPLAQLLTFALLISAIVLVSAAVGVVVGRWMAQR